MELRGRDITSSIRPGAHRGTWLAGLIALAGAVLLIYQWGAGHPFWVDEEMLALNLRGRSFTDLAGPLWLDQSAPLGWLAIERLVLLALGSGERALRLVPLLFGLGTLACAVWIGRRWLGAIGAAVLALLCAFGPWLVYHALELKPYSADAFWALLVPALAVWVLEPAPGAHPADTRRRLGTWWTVAAVGQWLGNGALLVTPACVVVLHLVLWRRHGWQFTRVTALGALFWLVAFGLHYHLALRHAAGSEALRSYWSFALAPGSRGLVGVTDWLMTRFDSLANKPVGSNHPVVFWLVAATGAAIAIWSRRAPGLLLALVPLSAFAWGMLRLVPVYERLSLWIVPALYMAVAVVAEGAVRLGQRGVARRRALELAVALAVLLPVGLVSVDVVRDGSGHLVRRRTDDYHQLDDRSGVRWLMKQRRPGDVLFTTHLALPAIWWYGGLSFPPRAAAGGTAEEIPVFEARLVPRGSRCQPSLAEQLGHPRRVLVYLGFRADDWPEAREDLLLTTLTQMGAITQFRTFATAGGAMVVDLAQPPSPGTQLPPRPWARASVRPPRPPGCVIARPTTAGVDSP